MTLEEYKNLTIREERALHKSLSEIIERANMSPREMRK